MCNHKPSFIKFYFSDVTAFSRKRVNQKRFVCKCCGASLKVHQNAWLEVLFSVLRPIFPFLALLLMLGIIYSSLPLRPTESFGLTVVTVLAASVVEFLIEWVCFRFLTFATEKGAIEDETSKEHPDVLYKQ